MPNNLKGYDAFQVLRSVFDVDKNCLRVCVVDGTTGGGPGFEVIIDHTNDSIRLGNGSSFLTSTTVGPDIGLDVNLINTSIVVTATNLNIRDLDHSRDNVTIAQGGNEANVNASNELQVRDDDANTTLTDVETNTDNLPKHADSGTTVKVSVGTGSEVEITASAGQQGITITNLTNQKIHISLNTGVDTTFKSLSKDDEFVMDNYSGSIFVIRASGTSDVQVDRRIRT